MREATTARKQNILMFRLIQIWLCLASAGCRPMTIGWGLPVRDPFYGMAFRNVSDVTLKHVKWSWPIGKREWVIVDGIFTPASGLNFAINPDPIPDKTNLSWTTPDGIQHHKVVQVASKLKDPRTFDGVIWLEIYGVGDNDFRLVPMRLDEGYYPPPRNEEEKRGK